MKSRQTSPSSREKSRAPRRLPSSNGGLCMEPCKSSSDGQDGNVPWEKMTVRRIRPPSPCKRAIRAWVEPSKPRRGGNRDRSAVPWRPQPFGDGVLVFDTETTTDAAQRLLFGFFRLYDRDRLVEEGLIAADVLDQPSMEAISEYAARCRLPIYSRERFVEEVLYPEVYVQGTLCVGFHLAF